MPRDDQSAPRPGWTAHLLPTRLRDWADAIDQYRRRGRRSEILREERAHVVWLRAAADALERGQAEPAVPVSELEALADLWEANGQTGVGMRAVRATAVACDLRDLIAQHTPPPEAPS